MMSIKRNRRTVVCSNVKSRAYAKCDSYCSDAPGSTKRGRAVLPMLPNQPDASPKCAAVILSQLGLVAHRKQMGGNTVRSWMDTETVLLG